MTEHANVVVVMMITFYILFIIILTLYHICQYITDLQDTAANIHHTETANHYQTFIPTAISKSKRKLTAFQN